MGHQHQNCVYTYYSVLLNNPLLLHLSTMKIILEFQHMVLLSTVQDTKNKKETIKETTWNPLSHSTALVADKLQWN